jgi:hypothetical protein
MKQEEFDKAVALVLEARKIIKEMRNEGLINDSYSVIFNASMNGIEKRLNKTMPVQMKNLATGREPYYINLMNDGSTIDTKEPHPEAKRSIQVTLSEVEKLVNGGKEAVQEIMEARRAIAMKELNRAKPESK